MPLVMQAQAGTMVGFVRKEVKAREGCGDGEAERGVLG